MVLRVLRTDVRLHTTGAVKDAHTWLASFTSGPVAGKKMVVQATNTGGDLGENHFDLLIPGGGVGIFNGCPAQYGSWNG
jgi:hypothetical protein